MASSVRTPGKVEYPSSDGRPVAASPPCSETMSNRGTIGMPAGNPRLGHGSRFRTLLLSATALLAVTVPVVALDCSEWNTRSFFKSADPPVTRCLQEGKDLFARDQNGWTPLHFAAAFVADEEIIKALTERGADASATDENGWTPVHFAAALNGNAEVISLLTNQEMVASASDDNGWTPLHLAAYRNDNPDVLRALIAAGADAGVRDWSGRTPLHWAAYRNTPAVIDALNAAGADARARDENGWTPLHWAAYGRDDAAVIKTLQAAGSGVDARDFVNGWTPLHLAAIGEHPHAVVALLDAGADAGTLNDDGEIAWDYVRENPVFKDTDAYRMLNAARF